MKRFYTSCTVGESEGGHEVLLDGRPIRTPGRRPLVLPSALLAQAVAGEWAAQAEEIRPDSMPIMKLATTVVDRLPELRGDALAELLGYAAADLLCYRTAHPVELAERQAALWQPWLDWAARHLDAPLRVTTDLEPLVQPPAALAALERAAGRLDDWRVVALHAVTRLTGSVVLGFAMLEGRLGAGEAFELSLVEELFEIAQWGLEEEQERRQARLRADLEAAAAFLAALPD